jgi:large subunit ribosomal protein L21
VYAVVESGGKQYKVTIGESIEVETVAGAIGSQVNLDRVLLVSDDKGLTVGKPTVEGASVSATVMEQGLRRKLVVFNFRPKQRYRVKTGHRQPFTRLRIDGIQL